jgi:ParB family chromosome partitioning protein
MIASRGLSVREAEKIVESSLVGKKRPRRVVSPSPYSDLEARLQKRLGTRVTIQSRGQSGKIIIHYFSVQELDGIIETLLT